MSDPDELTHLLQLRSATQRVLRDLEVKRASFGLDVPTHISMGIQQAKADLQVIEAKLQTVTPSQQVLDALGGDAIPVIVTQQLKEIRQATTDALTGMAKRIEEVAGQVERMDAAAIGWRRSEGKIRTQRQTEYDERMTLNEERTSGLETKYSDVSESIAWLPWRIALIMVIGVAVILAVLFVFFR